MPEILDTLESWRGLAWAPPWLVAAVLAAVAASIALIVHNAVVRSAQRHLPHRFVTHLLSRTCRIVRLTTRNVPGRPEMASGVT